VEHQEEEAGNDCCWEEVGAAQEGLGRGRMSSIGRVGGGAAGRGRRGMIAAGEEVGAAQVGWGRGG
jgi:hypothetical protein